jgi:hypothetical protein
LVYFRRERRSNEVSGGDMKVRETEKELSVY